MALDIPPEVAEHLGFYVYLYIDPRNDKPFYVGKGSGRRATVHLPGLQDGSDNLIGAQGEARKDQIIKELSAENLAPRLDILAHGLADEDTALRIEAAVIDLLGLDNLTNLVRGWRSIQLGRVPLEELITQYAAEPVENIDDSVLLIRINQQYRPHMSPEALYEATRGVWKLGERRERAEYALAVFEGVVRGVYEITEWFRAGTLEYKTRNEDLRVDGRWEFRGRPAPSAVREKYLGRSVAAYLAKSSQNPIKYVNC